MPRANRHFLPNQVWHLTQRCHKKQWLLKFNQDKRNWMRWLFESRRRYGLSVLNYIVTSNHIHLLVFDQGNNEIARSMQLIAGRTAQEYNTRKNRLGGFWQDRYHATAVQSDTHLQQCLTYIDLNMLRAGVVKHPASWPYGGYAEIQKPRERYVRIDHCRLLNMLNVQTLGQLQASRQLAVDEALKETQLQRNPIWTESVAVGTEQYLGEMKEKLKIRNPR